MRVHISKLRDRLLDICPNGQIGEDNDGQVIFYTGLRLSPDERDVAHDEDDDEVPHQLD